MNKNYGFVPSVIEADHYVLGSAELPRIILQANRNWKEFLPKWESQINGYETYGCTVFGTLNAIETYLKRLVPKDYDYSERFNYILAGVRSPGSDPHFVSEIVRKYGLIEQKELSMPQSYDDFIKPDPMTTDKLALGQEWMKQYSFGHEWVFNSSPNKEVRIQLIREALQYSPVCVSVSAWYQDENGLFVDHGQQNNHWTLCYGIDDDGGLLIFDSYALIQDGVLTNAFKKLHPDHVNIMAKRYSIQTKDVARGEELNWIQKRIKWIFEQIALLISKPESIAPTATVVVPVVETPAIPAPEYLWDTYENSRHSVRVLCDLMGLTLAEKNLICACIEQESHFNNNAVCRNKNKAGVVTSSDWGICQINDYYQTGKGLFFKDADDIVKNPEKAVRFMINMYKAGKLRLWVSYSSGAYLKYMPKSA